MDTGSFIIYVKTEDVYEDVPDDIEKRFDTSDYEVNRPLSTGKNKKVIGLMKDELEGKIMTKFSALIPKTCSYLMDDGKNYKKAKGTKKCVIKKYLNLMIIMMALRSNDDERLQNFDRITSYPYGTNAGKVCKAELLSKYK